MTDASTTARRLHTRLLAAAGRLLLEYNESTEIIQRTLARVARSLTEEAFVSHVVYGGVSVSFAGEPQTFAVVPELRFNTAVQARVHAILDRLEARELDAEQTLAALERVEVETPRYARLASAGALGLAAGCLAALLGADPAAVLTASVSVALGLLARQELAKRRAPLLALPFVAAFIGSLLGGLAIQFGATQTPELVVLVPSLMLVPGPHLINGLLDLLDNHLPICLARLGLAVAVLLASALGVVLGLDAAIVDARREAVSTAPPDLSVFGDMALAAVVAWGFAVFYNAPTRYALFASLGGMMGHGCRFLALEAGVSLEGASFLGGVVVGLVAARLTRSSRLPVAALAFAGAVTMMPGLQLYRALADALALVRQVAAPSPDVAVSALANASQGAIVVAALTLGVVLGSRVIRPER